MPKTSTERLKAVGATDEEKLKWAVDFAQMEMNDLREWEILKLREELKTFITFGRVTSGKIHVWMKHPFLTEYQRDDFKTLSSEFWSIFRDLNREVVSGIKLGADIICHLITAAGRVVASFQGSTRDMAIVKLIELLTHGSIERVKKCANEDCSQFFFKVKRQKYHNRKCMLEAREKKIKKAARGKIKEERRKP